jgi:hypothetical protein
MFGKQNASQLGNKNLPVSLICYTSITVGLTILCIFTCIVHSVLLHNWHAGFRTIYPELAKFDFIDYYSRSFYLHSQEFFSYNDYPWYYPAPAIFVLNPFYHLPGPKPVAEGYILYVLFTVFLLLVSARWLLKSIVAAGAPIGCARKFVIAAIFSSWPIYFALQRGNIEAFTWFLLAAAVWAYAKDKWMLAAILIGLAASIKIYPVLFLALFLGRRRFKELAVGIATAGVVTVAGLWFLEPNLVDSARRVAQGVREWTQDYSTIYDPFGQGYDHSIFNVIKNILFALHPGPAGPYHPHTSGPYGPELSIYLLSAGIIATVWFFALIWKLPRTNQILFLACAMIVLPPASFDYNLNSIYIPWAWLVLVAIEQHQEKKSVPYFTAVMCLLALVLAPETFLGLNGFFYAGVFKAICLVLLMLLASMIRFPDLKRSARAPSPTFET